MNGIVIIAHAPLASALHLCLAHVFPDRAQDVQAVDVQAQASPEQSLLQAQDAVGRLGRVPLLLLTDVLGATPANVARQLLLGQPGPEAGARRLLTGVNLPMLLRAVSYQTEPLERLTERVLQGGVQGIQEIAAH